jgi:hypothetical protein
MTIVARVDQQPGETQDWDIDFNPYLPDGDTIKNVSIAVTPATASPPPSYAVAPAYSLSAGIVKVWVYRGSMTNATTYKVTVTMESNDGRFKEAELFVKCKEL